MDKNSYSLISSNWMFSADTHHMLLPFLFKMVSGGEMLTEETLNATMHSFTSATKLSGPAYKTSLNSSQLQSESNGDKYVAIMNVHHPIFKYDQFCGPRGTQTMMAILDQWKEDDRIAGVVIDYNSGGGQVSGTREIANYLFEYPKPYVSYTNDITGSAAYYMMAGADHVIVSPYADFIGCIGSMAIQVNLDGILENQGGKIKELYADQSPEKNKQSRSLWNDDDERSYIEKFLNPSAEFFHEDMKKFRPQISELALKGDIFEPQEAINEGLADTLGTLQDAIAKVFELSTTNSNSNSNHMSKQRAKVQAVLSLNAPLESSDNGSYLNDEQLDALENRLETLETENAQLTTDLQAAQSQELQDQLTAAQTAATANESTVDTIMAAAGLEATGTLEEKLTALSAKVTEMGKKDGAKHTAPKVDPKGSNGQQSDFKVDATASHNQLADELYK